MRITNSKFYIYHISFARYKQKMALSKSLKKYSKNTNINVYVCTFQTPVGNVVACADDDFLYMVSFEDSKSLEKNLQTISDQTNCEFVKKKNSFLEKFDDELSRYFDGKLKMFTLPLKTFGSDFQKEVWKKMMELPYGSTQTYGDLAKSMGRTASHSRAIGAACGANGHVFVIPCHRIVASNSKGGFSSGVDRKEWLLIHEKKHDT